MVLEAVTNPGGSKYVKRVTMLKVPKEDNFQAILKQYEVVRRMAQKVCISCRSTGLGRMLISGTKNGKPYVLALDFGQTDNASEPRAQGYTTVVQIPFANRDDAVDWDTQCEARKAFKALVTTRHQGICTSRFETDRI
jgi:hypothetical protein